MTRTKAAERPVDLSPQQAAEIAFAGSVNEGQPSRRPGSTISLLRDSDGLAAGAQRHTDIGGGTPRLW